ncbi:MAG: cytochrome P450 family protein [bacterium]
MALPVVDVTSSEFKARAYDYYAKLRAEAPVQAVKLPNRHTVWLVSRYDDVAALLKDARLAKDRNNATGSRPFSRLPGMLGFLQAIERNMLDLDVPHHTRLRGLVHLAFTPRLVERMRSRIEDLSEELLARAIRRGRMDLIADYALPIPLTVISEMLGIPTADQLGFHRWSSAVVAATAKPNLFRVLPAIWNFVRYLRRIIAAKRERPEDDLISALVAAEESGERLREDELVAMVFLLVIAGHETTVNLIGNGTLALLQWPEQHERLRAEPQLDASAVEELLRYDSPVEVSTERYAREPITIAGVTIPTGALVYGVLASANRDATQFEEPDRLDLGREKNRHLAFGQGIHYCLGAPLARLEGRIAIRRLLDRIPGLELAVPCSALRWRKGLNIRGLEELPVAW